MLDIDTCAVHLSGFVANSVPPIIGPHEIAYGWGWSPTISYWLGSRRVHLYVDLYSEDAAYPFAVEIADGHMYVCRCHVSTIDQIRDIMDRFLCRESDLHDLADYEWIHDNFDSDSAIPDPPNRLNSANIAEFCGKYIVAGGPPAILEKKSWWEILLANLMA